MRGVPFEYRQDVFDSLYGKPGEKPEETVRVAGAEIEKSTLDVMHEMRARQQARRDSRTDPEPEK